MEIKKGLVWPKRWETLREVSTVPMFMQRTSPHPAAKGLLTTWMWKVMAITAFLLPSLHMLPEGFFTSIFLISPCFWPQTFLSLGQMDVVNIQIGYTASTQGARTEPPQQHALCPSAQHMCTRAEALHGSWGGTRSLATQLLLWSRLKCDCQKKICFGAILD